MEKTLGAYSVGQIVIFLRSNGQEWRGEIEEIFENGVYHVKFEGEDGEEKGKKILLLFLWERFLPIAP